SFPTRRSSDLLLQRGGPALGGGPRPPDRALHRPPAGGHGRRVPCHRGGGRPRHGALQDGGGPRHRGLRHHPPAGKLGFPRVFTVALQSVQTFIISIWHTVTNTIHTPPSCLPTREGLYRGYFTYA